MSPEPRIGLLTPGWPGQATPNGIATSVYNLALGLRDIDRTPVILTFRIDGDGPTDIPVVKVPDLAWHWYDRLRAKLGDSEAVHRHSTRVLVAAVNTAVTQHGIDILLIEETNGWAAMIRPHVSVPIVVVLHGPWVLHKRLGTLGAREDARRERRERKGFAAAAGLIAPSRNVLDAVEAALPLPDTPKIVLPNCLALPGDSPPISADLTSQDILFVGRFDFHKGGDVVLKAFSELLETHPEAKLRFVGPDRGVKQPDGSLLHIQTMLEALPHARRARIDYRGGLERPEVTALRARHPITIIASRYENLNYTLLEAMAAGQAIVCTDVGGPAEILEDGKTALLVPPEDPAAMAEALARLLDNPDLTQRLGHAARQEMAGKFEARSIATQTVDFIDVLKETHAG